MSKVKLLLLGVLSVVAGSAGASLVPPGFEGAECVFPEPEAAVCSGQHPGDASTATTLDRTTVGQIVTPLSGAASFSGSLALAGREGGDHRFASRTFQAAGDGLFSQISAWASYSFTSTQDEFAPTAFDSDLNVFMAGADVTPLDNVVLGVALGYESNSVDTRFNAGSQEIDGWTAALYGGVLITDFVSVDASLGYSDLSIDQDRIDSTNFTNVIRSETDADRLFGSANVNVFTTFESLRIGGRVGVVLAKQDIDAVVESGGPDAFTSRPRTIELGQIQVGAELAYEGGVWEPYANAHYENDFNRQDVLLNSKQSQPSNDDDGFVVGAGIRYFGESGWSGNASFSSVLGRQDLDSFTLMLMMHHQF